jgi:hypothetical protein
VRRPRLLVASRPAVSPWRFVTQPGAIVVLGVVARRRAVRVRLRRELARGQRVRWRLEVTRRLGAVRLLEVGRLLGVEGRLGVEGLLRRVLLRVDGWLRCSGWLGRTGRLSRVGFTSIVRRTFAAPSALTHQ